MKVAGQEYQMVKVAEGRNARLDREAADWLVRVYADDVSIADMDAFEAWLKADPAHEHVFRLQEAAWSASADMQHLAYLKEADHQQGLLARLYETCADAIEGFMPQGRFAYGLLACAITVLVFAGIALFEKPAPLMVQEYKTAAGEIQDVILADGTQVILGAGSILKTSFDDQERHVSLEKGEAYFSVSKDMQRPFSVDVENATIRVLGTAFDVHRGLDAVRISVESGMVEVLKGSAVGSSEGYSDIESAKKVLQAGEQVFAPYHAPIGEVKAIAVADVGLWRSGQLVYVNAPLKDVLADVSRYYKGKIILKDEKLGETRLTLSFKAGQFNRMLELLVAALPIEATSLTDELVILRGKSS